MRGRGVDCAGALVRGDVVCEHAEDGAIEKRMLEGGALELRAFEACDLLCRFQIAGLLYRIGQRSRDDVDAAVRVFKRDVFELRVEGDGERGRAASTAWWSR